MGQSHATIAARTAAMQALTPSQRVIAVADAPNVIGFQRFIARARETLRLRVQRLHQTGSTA